VIAAVSNQVRLLFLDWSKNTYLHPEPGTA
jgi:hypothetical protein